MPEKNNWSQKGPQLSLKNLLDIKEWQRIQDNFSAITDVCLRTLDAQGQPFTAPSREPRLCSELITDPHVKTVLCGSCLPTFLGGKAVLDKNLSVVCQSGLHKFLTPLKSGRNVFGYIILGPVILVMRKPKEEYRRIAEKLEVDLEEFWSALLEIKTISFHAAQSLIELIKHVGEYTLKLAYREPVVCGKEKVVQDTAKINRLLNTLLDVALQITQASIGSVMLLDESKGELFISTQRGLPEKIAKKTRVKIGEGICGIVAQEERPLLIDENIEDSRIKRCLKRPYIGSAMILPIKVEEQIWGVMNIGSLKTSNIKFNPDNLHLVNRLIDLATIALHQ